MRQAVTLHELMLLRKEFRPELEALNGNLGTALGFKKYTGESLDDAIANGDPAVIVFVPRKINPKWIPGAQQIPKELRSERLGLWCPLDVVEGGKAESGKSVEPAYDEITERLRGWDEQIYNGSQVAHWTNRDEGSYSIGTIGAFAKSRQTGRPGFITNQHVGLNPGQELYHPVPYGTLIGTTRQSIEYVPDEAWYREIDEKDVYVRADCAFAELAPGFNDYVPEMLGVGKLGEPSSIDIQAPGLFPIGERVLRLGRTTGLRYGTVVAFGYEFIDETGIKVYTDLLIVGDAEIPFSTHGDSGSLIVLNNEQKNPVGLLWGGWQEKLRTGKGQENWTYGTAIGRVLDVLDVELH